MSVPHLDAFASAIADDSDQRQRSRYMAFFAQPDKPEQSLATDDFAALRSLWSSIPGEQVDEYISVFSQPGALTAALNWYRANVNPARPGLAGMEFPPVKAPTLGLWSTGDAYLTESQMTASKRFVTGEWRYERIENASHWMQLDQPERVNALLLDWLGRPGRG